MNTENATKIAEKTDVGDVFGKVIHIIDYPSYCEVVINKGKNDGISTNDQFLIYAIGEELFDPDTKESLGKLEIVKGVAKPKHIQEKATTLSSAEYRPSRKRIIKRDNPFSIQSSREEEIIESPPETIPFREVKVGDLVKPMKRKIF